MKASIVELRTRMKYISKALLRNEPVTILSHGKVFGVLRSYRSEKEKARIKSVKTHPFFGSVTKPDRSVDELMENIRGSRF